MSSFRFIRTVRLPWPATRAFAWHERPGAFERLTPPWERVRVIEQSGGLADGGRVVLEIDLGPLPLRWVAEHHGYVPGQEFRDVAVGGPFPLWSHRHRLRPLPDGGSELEDDLTWAPPLGSFGARIGRRLVERRLERLFTYRHRVTMDDMAAMAAGTEVTPMRILVTGSTGLVGAALTPLLTTAGHTVVPLVRRAPVAGAVTWDPAAGKLDPAALAGFDAVVHLAGESIAGRWSEARKAAIRSSRVEGTRLLAQALSRCPKPPRVLVCASAIGYYGNRGEERLDDGAAPGHDFLAEVCQAWEAAAAPASEAGIRVAHLRFGVILSPRGGALGQMLLPFKLGVGGRIGDGRQHMSWIAIDDAIGAIHHVLITDGLRGPINTVAPGPVTNAEFTRILGQVLGRPTIFPVPAFAARLAFGEMADALLLASQRVEPARLLASGYRFRFPDLEPALRHVLGRVRG